MLITNNLLAQGLGGGSDDFEGKNCYDLFPRDIAKKYHENDLKSIATNTSLLNIIEPYQLPNSPIQWISINKIPIIQPSTNKNDTCYFAEY